MRCPDCGYLLLDPEAHCPKCEKTLAPSDEAPKAPAAASSADGDDVGDVSYPSFSGTGSRSLSSSRGSTSMSGALATAAALAYDDDDSSDPNLPVTGEAEAEPPRPGLRVVDITEEESVGETTENHFPVDYDAPEETAESEELAAATEESAEADTTEITGDITADTSGALGDMLDKALGEATDWSGFFKQISERDELARAQTEAAAEQAEQMEAGEDSRSDNIVDAEEALTGELDADMAGDLPDHPEDLEMGDSTDDAVAMDDDEFTGSVVNDPTPIPELPALLRDDAEPSSPRIEEEIARAEAIATEGFSAAPMETGETSEVTGGQSGTDPVFAAAFDALQAPESPALTTDEISNPKAELTLPTAVVHPYELPVESPEEGAITATELEIDPEPVSLESLVAPEPLESQVADETSLDLTDRLNAAAARVPTEEESVEEPGDISAWDATAFEDETTAFDGDTTEVTPSVFDAANLDAISQELPEEPSLPSIPSTTPSAFDALLDATAATGERSLTSPKQIDLEDAIARAEAVAEEDPNQTVVSVRMPEQAPTTDVDDVGEKTLVSNPGRLRTQISFPHFSIPSHPASAQALGNAHERSGDFPTADILGEASTRMSTGALPTARTYRNKAAGRRLLAFAIDNLLTLGLACGFVFLAHLATGVGVGPARGSAGGAAPLEVLAAVLVLRFFLDAFYQVGYVTLTGQTQGLRFMGLRVRSEVSRGRPNLGQALRRWLWSYWLTYGICWGFLAISRDPRGRALHDKKARTRIVPA